MSRTFTKTLPFIALLSVSAAACSDASDTKTAPSGVIVTVNGITQSGKVYVALQTEDIFGAAKADYGTAVDASTAKNGSVSASISDVAAGKYAIAVFQDTNGNGKMDVGSNGISTEPWALSNGAGTAGAPKFAKAMMALTGNGDRVSITVK